MTQDDLRAQLEGLARQLRTLNAGIEGIERRLSAVEQQTATDLWQWAANHWKTTMALTPLVSLF
jgi:predicted Zn-dependent peptidase